MKLYFGAIAFNNNLEIVCFVLAVLSIILGIMVIVDFFKQRKKAKRIVLPTLEELKEEKAQIQSENLSQKEEIKNISVVKEETSKIPLIHEIKYVEENEELEKTKAKLELARIKEELKRKELEEERIFQELREKRLEKQEEIKELENKEIILENEEEIPVFENNEETEEISSILPVVEIKEDTFQVEEAKNEISLAIEANNIANSSGIVSYSPNEQIELEEVLENSIEQYENAQEENAIISFDELDKANVATYTDEDMELYKDEGNEPISIQELDKLYAQISVTETTPIVAVEEESITTINIEQEKIKDVELKEVMAEQEINQEKEDKSFQSTPFISPVYGVSKTEDSLLLEQTANLEKLNEEIKKTNEFLNVLRELKKNLE